MQAPLARSEQIKELNHNDLAQAKAKQQEAESSQPQQQQQQQTTANVSSIEAYIKSTTHNQHNILNSIDAKGFEVSSIMEKLQAYYTELDIKVNKVNKAYDNLRQAIRDEFTFVSKQVEDETDLKKIELNDIEAKLENDINLRLYEIMFDLKQKYEMNEDNDKLRKKINTEFTSIQTDLTDYYHGKIVLTSDQINKLVERLECLSCLIDDNQKNIMPTVRPDRIISFKKTPESLTMSNVGLVTYEPSYKLSIVNQIKNLNDRFRAIHIDLVKCFPNIPGQCIMKMISKNRLLFMYQRVHGRVKTLSMYLLYSYDLSVLNSVEIDNHLESLQCHCLFQNRICLVFRKSHKDYLVKVFDTDLNFLREKFVDMNVHMVRMSLNRIFLINLNKMDNQVREYDRELNQMRKFGQQKLDKKPFSLKGSLIAINEHKIFVRMNQTIKVNSFTSGERITEFTIADLDDRSQIFLDFTKEKFIVFNGFERVSYYNHDGHQLCSNKIRGSEQKYDEFHISINGNFAFVNNQQKRMMII